MSTRDIFFFYLTLQVFSYFKVVPDGANFSVYLLETQLYAASSALITCGVPQSSVLGSLLFSLFTCFPLASYSGNMFFRRYADDSLLYVPLKKVHQRRCFFNVQSKEDKHIWPHYNSE